MAGEAIPHSREAPMPPSNFVHSAVHLNVGSRDFVKKEGLLIGFDCWHQGYVDDQLLATGHVTKAVIMGLDGSQWAISANFAVR